MPEGVAFQESWRIGLDLLDRCRAGRAVRLGGRRRRVRPGGGLPGRAAAAAAALRAGRAVQHAGPRPGRGAGRRAGGGRRGGGWTSGPQAQPASRWRRLVLGRRAKGPKVVRAAGGVGADQGRGRRRRPAGAAGGDPHGRTESRGLVHAVATPGRTCRWPSWRRSHGRRHGVEEVLQAGKGEVGWATTRCGSWVGWHHHMTLSLLALWFLSLEKRRLGEKNAGVDGAADAGGVRPAAAAGAAQPPADRRRSQPGAAAERGGADLPLVHGYRQVPAATGTARRIKRLQSK